MSAYIFIKHTVPWFVLAVFLGWGCGVAATALLGPEMGEATAFLLALVLSAFGTAYGVTKAMEEIRERF